MEGLARAGYSHGLKISAQAVDKRFTKAACHFLKELLEEAAGEVMAARPDAPIALFNRFEAVYVTDCSTVTLPTELKDLWQGVGGAPGDSQAGVKMDTRLELKTGQLHMGLLPGRQSDNRSLTAETAHEKGSLRLQDLGYFNLQRMKEQAARGEYWLSRLQPRTQVYDERGAWIDLDSTLQTLLKQGVLQHERAVQVGASERLPARLLLWKLPEEAASRRRANMHENARNQGRTLSRQSLAWCDWNLLISNVGADKLSHSECFLLYGVRWQIELLFKCWKSQGGVGHSRSEKPYRILCELYAKLLCVLVEHWIILTGLWRLPDRSLVKGCQMIKEQSARLAACMEDLEALTALLKELAERFKQGCSLNPRKKHPNTSQRLKSGRAFS